MEDVKQTKKEHRGEGLEADPANRQPVNCKIDDSGPSRLILSRFESTPIARVVRECLCEEGGRKPPTTSQNM